MDDTKNIILDRLLQAAGLRRDSQLAELLGVSPQAISQARRKERIPDGWILNLAARFPVSTDWLCFGVDSPTGEQSGPENSVPSASGITGEAATTNMPSPLDLPGSIAATHINYARDRHAKSKKNMPSQSVCQPASAACAGSGSGVKHDMTQSVLRAGHDNVKPLHSKSTPSRYAEVALPLSSRFRGENAEIIEPGSLDVALVPLVGARLAAGAGSLETDADVQGYFAFRQDWLCRKGNPESMVLMKVFGDSMEPDIRHGDMVLVNQGHTQIFGHAIYAVGVNEEIYIKQVETRPGGLLRLRSLNPRYEPIEINLRGDLESSVRIIGRVIWWCREA